MPLKALHQFTVTIDREIEDISTRTEGGKEITERTKVVRPVQVTIVLKEPTRREKQDLSLFQDIAYGRAIDMGLLPRLVMIQKLARDSGGSLSGDEDKTHAAMNARIQELANDYIRLKTKSGETTEEDRARMERLEVEYNALQKRVVDLNTSYQSIFAHTAEQYKQNQALTWLTLFLTYMKVGPDRYDPLFKGADFKAKEDALGELEDSADPIYLAAVQKLSTCFMLYYLGHASKPEDFVRIEAEWAKQLEAQHLLEEKAKADAEATAQVEPISAAPEAAPEAAPVS